MIRLFVGLAAVVALATACGQPSQPAAQTSPTPGTVSSPSPTVTAGRLPARLQIPKIGVDASVEQVGVDAGGNMDVPKSPKNVAWYSPGVAPGQKGDAVIAGHLDWYSGRAVFWDLSKLQASDEIVVQTQDGAKMRFKVSATQTVSYDAHPAGLFDRDGSPRLSLITCAGSWDKGRDTYQKRLIVDATYAGQA